VWASLPGEIIDNGGDQSKVGTKQKEAVRQMMFSMQQPRRSSLITRTLAGNDRLPSTMKEIPLVQ